MFEHHKINDDVPDTLSNDATDKELHQVMIKGAHVARKWLNVTMLSCRAFSCQAARLCSLWREQLEAMGHEYPFRGLSVEEHDKAWETVGADLKGES